uniref:hydroxymethylbilane synthase n=1 Tax=Macrostomum lignano TaxID=282301 RepID=A0A1I8FAC1_9PLAT
QKQVSNGVERLRSSPAFPLPLFLRYVMAKAGAPNPNPPACMGGAAGPTVELIDQMAGCEAGPPRARACPPALNWTVSGSNRLAATAFTSRFLFVILVASMVALASLVLYCSVPTACGRSWPASLEPLYGFIGQQLLRCRTGPGCVGCRSLGGCRFVSPPRCLPEAITMQLLRPVVPDCNFCRNLTAVPRRSNLDPAEFQRESSTLARVPVVVTDVCTAPASAEEEHCQFFPYKSEFANLGQVFAMPEAQARMEPGYVGWSNCSPRVAASSAPTIPGRTSCPASPRPRHRLGVMGSPNYGAHICTCDDVGHVSWQGAGRGRKRWDLMPPLECSYQCQPISVVVIALDTTLWYHGTRILDGDMSIAIGADNAAGLCQDGQRRRLCERELSCWRCGLCSFGVSIGAARRLGGLARRSELALRQTHEVLRQLGPDCGRQFRIVHMDTIGDQILDRALSHIGDKGLFTQELDAALLSGQVQLVVHSLKDLPTPVPDGLAVPCILRRELPRDALVLHPRHVEAGVKDLAGLPPGSPPPLAQLSRAHPGLRFQSVRGNLGTRWRKLNAQECGLDGLILAEAGLVRMGWTDRIACSLQHCLPAVGQGALAVQCRDDDQDTVRLLRPLLHRDSFLEVRGRSLMGLCAVFSGAGQCQFVRLVSARLVSASLCRLVSASLLVWRERSLSARPGRWVLVPLGVRSVCVGGAGERRRPRLVISCEAHGVAGVAVRDASIVEVFDEAPGRLSDALARTFGEEEAGADVGESDVDAVRQSAEATEGGGGGGRQRQSPESSRVSEASSGCTIPEPDGRDRPPSGA